MEAGGRKREGEKGRDEEGGEKIWGAHWDMEIRGDYLWTIPIS